MGIELKNITQKYGEVTAVDNISLHIDDGEMVVLVGPSGCGKTTLLRTIAGLIPLCMGKILLNSRDISRLSPQERNTVIVFQNYALFPHMTVEENIAYGLKVKKIKSAKIQEKVEEILNKVELSGLSKRKINELSGGQQQRVALARALVVEPNVLLFDEPLSNLDQKLRVSMRQKIREIQREYGITSIYVTHDQEEAMSISDKIAVMRDGKIEQFGTASELYFNPKNKFVAEFMGTANIINFKDITLNACELKGEILGKSIRLSEKEFIWNGKPDIQLMLRPEDIEIKENGRFEGIVKWQEVLGPVKRIALESNGNTLIVEKRKYHKSGMDYTNGSEVRFDIDMREAHIIE